MIPPQISPAGRETAAEGLRLSILSVASLILGYLLTVTTAEILELNLSLAYACATVTCSILNFFACRNWVFRGAKGSLTREAAKFFPSILLFRALETAVFSALLWIIPNYHLTYFLTAITALTAKFFVSKHFIFRRGGK